MNHSDSLFSCMFIVVMMVMHFHITMVQKHMLAEYLDLYMIRHQKLTDITYLMSLTKNL